MGSFFFVRDWVLYDSKEFEWTATMININPSHNESITEKCPKLKGYIYFVERTRFYKREGLELTEALDCAVEDSIRNGFISDFLQLHRKEVLDMSITEFDEKAFEEMLREEGRKEGIKEGRKEGIEEGIKKGREQGRKEGSMESLINLYKEGIISLDVVSSQLNLSNEELTLLLKNTK